MPLPIANGESGASVRAKINQAFADLDALAGAEPYPAVATFASLPGSAAEGTTYIVSQSSGIYFINRRPAGFYRYSGGVWVYLGEVPDSYFTDETMVFSDNTDPTKKAKFELSGITAGATRTLTFPDGNGVIARVSDLPSAGSITNWNTAFSWGNHASAGYLLPASIGVTVQGYNVNTVIDAAYVHTDNNFTTALLSKLNGIAAGATANSSDATLLNRANHSGSQLAATISDFNATARAQTEAELVAGANVTITPAGSGATRTLTIAATGGGGGGVSSVAMSVPTGLAVAGSPITSSGTLEITYAAGHSIPTDAAQSAWTTAFGWGNHATAGYLASSHAGAGGTAHAAATTSVAGFMSAADKTKLDGVASGATANTGTVTSVGMSVPTGLSIAGSPVTTSGTLAVTLTAGYVIPTQATLDAKKGTTQTVGTSLGTTGTVNLDLAALTGTLQTIAATGNITFTTSNRAAGRSFELRIAANGATRTLTWPSWVAFGAALPTSLASGAVLRVAISCTGTTDASIDAASAVSV